MDQVEGERKEELVAPSVPAPVEPEKIEKKEVKHRSIRESLKENLHKEIPTEPRREAVKADTPPAPPATPTPEAPRIAVAPPADMSAAEKEAFGKLTPDMQQYISRRAYETRNHLSQKAMELGQREKQVSAVLDAVSPFRESFAKSGVDEGTAIKRALTWISHVDSNGAAGALEFLDTWGITPEDLIQARDNGGQRQAPEGKNPGYLTREEAEKLAEEKFQNLIQQREQQSTTQLRAEAVNKFISSKPLFQDPGTALQLEDAMAQRVARLVALEPSTPAEKLLDEAYDFVTKNVSPFKELQEKLNAKTEIERSRQEAQRSLQASRSISGGPGSSGTPTKKVKDVRENLRLRLHDAM